MDLDALTVVAAATVATTSTNASILLVGSASSLLVVAAASTPAATATAMLISPAHVMMMMMMMAECLRGSVVVVVMVVAARIWRREVSGLMQLPLLLVQHAVMMVSMDGAVRDESGKLATVQAAAVAREDALDGSPVHAGSSLRTLAT